MLQITQSYYNEVAQQSQGDSGYLNDLYLRTKKNLGLVLILAGIFPPIQQSR